VQEGKEWDGGQVRFFLIIFLVGCAPRPSIENGYEFISGYCWKIVNKKMDSPAHDSECLFWEGNIYE